MALLRRLFRFLRARKAVAVRRGYTEEVLYSGWVDTVPPKVNPPRPR